LKSEMDLFYSYVRENSLGESGKKKKKKLAASSSSEHVAE